LAQLEEAIRTLQDKTIEWQKGKSWPAEYYQLGGPQLVGKPRVEVFIRANGGICVWCHRRYFGWKDEDEMNSGVKEHMVLFCEDPQWMLLCDTMDKWTYPGVLPKN
jgi:hypothetical protein